MLLGTPSSLTGSSYLTTGSPTSTPATISLSSQPASTEQHDTNASSLSNGLCNKASALQAQTRSTSPNYTTNDKPLLSTTSTAPNPFSSLPDWQALGFENPHASPKRNASFSHTADRPTTAHTKTTPAHKRAQSPAQMPVKQPWPGSEMFNECHRPLSLGHTIFDPEVGDRRRTTYLSGFGKGNLPPLKFGDGSGETGQKGGRGGRRERGGWFKSSAHGQVIAVGEFEERSGHGRRNKGSREREVGRSVDGEMKKLAWARAD